MGRIVTFFSYKGGVGRSMALANVGVLLARWGHRVLMVDWDLEAPGLESFFRDHLDGRAAAEARGVIDLLCRGYQSADELVEISYWNEYPLPVRIPSTGGTLQLMTAGRQDSDYFHKVQSLDVKTLYAKQHGGQLIEQLREDWQKSYDFVLIDSRTGITDIGGICTVQLPDLLVVLFTATGQALCGALSVAKKAARARQKLPFERLQVPVLPIPSRFDSLPEFKVSQEWLDRFATDLKPLYEGWLPKSVPRRDVLEVTKLPYVSYFSFGEKLPVLEQGTNDPASLGYAYANLAALVAHGLADVETLLEDRGEYLKTAYARRSSHRQKVLVFFSHRDEVWLERLHEHLRPLEVGRRLELWTEEAFDSDRAWAENLPSSLGRAAVALLLVSQSFLASKFLTFEEVGRAFTEEENQGLTVVPILLEPSLWLQIPWIARHRALPREGRSLTELQPMAAESELAAIGTEIAELMAAATAPVELVSKRSSPRFDIFLSYSSPDRTAVRELASALSERALRVWFDEWELQPGMAWSKALERAIADARAVAVLVGPAGSGPWQEAEMRSALAAFAARGRPVIPILLPGAPGHPDLPLFLAAYSAVDLRAGLTPEGLDRLEWGITGIRPANGHPSAA